MAELKNIGKARNRSEAWAAEYLAEKLPDHYRIYTNFYLVANGEPYEVDMAVLADYTIHLIDVKGFMGEVSYDQRAFKVDGLTKGVGDLDKISYLSRALVREWKKYTGIDCPWLQGSIFVTGSDGNALDLQHPEGMQLDIHGPDSIIDYLTKARKPTERNRITDASVLSFERLLNVPKGDDNESLHDFKLLPNTQKDLNTFASVQDAQHLMNSLPITYQLFMVDRSLAPSVDAFKAACRMLRNRYKAMLSLRGITGVPRCLPPFEEHDGERFVFPVEKVGGRSLSEVCRDASIELDRRIELFLSVIRIVNEAHQRDIYSKTLDANKVIVTENLEIVVHGWVSEKDEDAADDSALRDVLALAEMGITCFTETVWKDDVVTACPDLAEWCEEVLLGNYRPLEQLISALDSRKIVQVHEGEPDEPFEIGSGAVINGHYELMNRLGEGASGEVWSARHLLGNFECCVKIITIPYGAEALARSEFETLTQLFHPNIVRLFSFQQIQGSDLFCLVMGMGEMTLRELIDGEEQSSRSAMKWFEGLISALQYMRSLPEPILHRDIKPRNMVITDNHASLIDFNLSGHFSGTLRYLSPQVSGEHEYSPDDDLYSLCLSFYELLTGYPNFDGQPEFKQVSGACPEGFPERVFERITDVLGGDFPESGASLKDWFCVSGFIPTHEQPLPKGFGQRWNIRSDERFVISTLLQHGGKMTKKQLIDRSAKWAFGHVGKDDRSRINTRLSGLRDKGLIDYPKGRQPKGKRVSVKIVNPDLQAAWDRVCG